MDIVWRVLVFVVGVFLLIKSADFFVDAASVIARKLKISPLIIGLTIVALGTSLPEFAVSLSSALKSAGTVGSTADLALGNVVGSNIANLTLILGISALMSPIFVQKNLIKRDLPMLVAVSFLLFIIAFFFQVDKAIVWWEALIFILLLIAYIFILVRSTKNNAGNEDDPSVVAIVPEVSDKAFSVWTIVFLVLGGLGIALGAELVTQPAVYIAEKMATGFGLDPVMATTLVGVSVVAIGTSLPELATSLAAAKKGENGIVLGNILGSNILNILFILGISGLIIPLGVSDIIIVDMIIMLAITLVAALLILKKKLTKIDGIILLSIFISYMTYVILRTVL